MLFVQENLLVSCAQWFMLMFGKKNGGFWDRAVGSEVCAVAALGKAAADGDVWKKTGAFGAALLVPKCAQPLRCQ